MWYPASLQECSLFSIMGYRAKYLNVWLFLSVILIETIHYTRYEIVVWKTSVSVRWLAPYAVILRHFGKIIFTTAVPMLMPFFGVCFTVLGWKAERVQKHATSYWDARTPARNLRLSQSQLGKIWEEWKNDRKKEWKNDTHSGFLILDREPLMMM